MFAGSCHGSSLVVMSKGTRYTQQSYKVSDAFPFEWIKKKWKENFYITSMATAGQLLCTCWVCLLHRASLHLCTLSVVEPPLQGVMHLPADAQWGHCVLNLLVACLPSFEPTSSMSQTPMALTREPLAQCYDHLYSLKHSLWKA